MCSTEYTYLYKSVAMATGRQALRTRISDELGLCSAVLKDLPRYDILTAAAFMSVPFITNQIRT